MAEDGLVDLLARGLNQQAEASRRAGYLIGLQAALKVVTSELDPETACRVGEKITALVDDKSAHLQGLTPS